MMESNEHVTELLPEYALGVLGEPDTLRVIEHLQDCDLCSRELEAYQPVMAGLGGSAQHFEPPVDLRSRILAMAAQSEQVHLPKRQPQQVSFLSKLFTLRLVGALAVFLLVAGSLFVWSRLNAPGTQAGLNGFRAVAMVGTEDSPAAIGTVIISQDGRYGTLVVDDLEPLDDQHQYQFWLIEGGQRTSGGVFSVSRSGYAALEVWSEKPLDSFDAFGITIEPVGGSPQPTGMKVLGTD